MIGKCSNIVPVHSPKENLPNQLSLSLANLTHSDKLVCELIQVSLYPSYCY